MWHISEEGVLWSISGGGTPRIYWEECDGAIYWGAIVSIFLFVWRGFQLDASVIFYFVEEGVEVGDNYFPLIEFDDSVFF